MLINLPHVCFSATSIMHAYSLQLYSMLQVPTQIFETTVVASRSSTCDIQHPRTRNVREFFPQMKSTIILIPQ